MPPPPPPAKRGGKKGLAPTPTATASATPTPATVAPTKAAPIATSVCSSTAVIATSTVSPAATSTVSVVSAKPPSQTAKVIVTEKKASGVTPPTLLADYDVQIEECRTFLRQLTSSSSTKKGAPTTTLSTGGLEDDPLSTIQFPLHATHHRRVRDTVRRLRRMQSKLIQEASKITGQAAARRVMEQYGGLQKRSVNETPSPSVVVGSKRPR